MKPGNIFMNRWLIGGVTAFLLIALVLSQTIFTVKYGSVAVLTRFGKVEGNSLKPGLHVKIPFIDEVVVYRTQMVVYEALNVDPYNNDSMADYQDYAVDTTTQDGQQITITYTVRFAINEDKVKSIANNIGTEQDIVEKIVKTETRVKARSVPRNFKAFDLYTGNIDTVSQMIQETLEPVFTKNGLVLDEFGIRAIRFSPDYVTTIEQKQIEREKIETEKYRAEQEEYKKQAAITKAQGEAEAQRLLQVTLTPGLLQKLYIEKWNGILPEVMTDGGSSLLLDLNK